MRALRLYSCGARAEGELRLAETLLSQKIQVRIWAEIDREARKGKPIPSDHAPLVIDLDTPGHPLDAGWTSAESRIAGRR